MAGVGEAASIITIAALGVSLASALHTFVGEFQEASSRIDSLSNEIWATYYSLQRLGERAKQKPLTGNGALKADDLTKRCDGVLREIRSTLKKGDESLDPNAVNRTEIDISLFEKWRWAWSQKKLHIPRIELDRLKADITMLLITFMAIEAPTEREREHYKGDIPGIHRTLEWANQRYEEALNRQEPNVQGLRPMKRGTYIDNEAEPEVWKAFLEYNKAKLIEDREKRRREQLELQRLVDERKQEEEKRRVKEIRDIAITEYEEEKKREEAENEKQMLESKNELRGRLKDAHISEDQIQAVLDGITPDQGLIPFYPKSSTKGDSSVSISAVDPLKTKQKASIVSWLSKKFRKPVTTSTHESFRDQLGRNQSKNPAKVEVWVFDGVEIADLRFRARILSESEYERYWTKPEIPGSDKKISETIAKLNPWFKKMLLSLLNEKLQDLEYTWLIASFENVLKSSRSGLMRRTADQPVCLELILKGYCMPEDGRSPSSSHHGSLDQNPSGSPNQGSSRRSKNPDDGPGSLQIQGDKPLGVQIVDSNAPKVAEREVLWSRYRKQSPERGRWPSSGTEDHHSSPNRSTEVRSYQPTHSHRRRPQLRSNSSRYNSLIPTRYNALVPTKKSTTFGRESDYEYELYENENLDGCIRIAGRDDGRRQRGVRRDTDLSEAAVDRERSETIRSREEQYPGKKRQRPLVRGRGLGSSPPRQMVLYSPRQYPPRRSGTTLESESIPNPRRRSYERDRERQRERQRQSQRQRSRSRPRYWSDEDDEFDPQSPPEPEGPIFPARWPYSTTAVRFQDNSERGGGRKQSDAEIIEKQLTLYTGSDRSTSFGMQPEAGSGPENGPTSDTRFTRGEPTLADDPSGITHDLYDEPESM